MSRDEEEKDAGEELGEADQAEIERAAGEAVDLPADGDGLHLGRRGGEKARRHVEAESWVVNAMRPSDKHSL